MLVDTHVIYFDSSFYKQKGYTLYQSCIEINVREYWKVNQKWTIENRKTKNTTQYALDTTMRK